MAFKSGSNDSQCVQGDVVRMIKISMVESPSFRTEGLRKEDKNVEASLEEIINVEEELVASPRIGYILGCCMIISLTLAPCPSSQLFDQSRVAESQAMFAKKMVYSLNLLVSPKMLLKVMTLGIV